MAEYIEREALIENLNRFAPEHYNALVNQLITKQPAADVVEVVRCKDCESRIALYPEMTFNGRKAQYCINWCKPTADNDFCSHGKRR